MACEQGVFAIEGDGADQVFNTVGIDLDPSILQEGLQSVPVIS